MYFDSLNRVVVAHVCGRQTRAGSGTVWHGMPALPWFAPNHTASHHFFSEKGHSGKSHGKLPKSMYTNALTGSVIFNLVSMNQKPVCRTASAGSGPTAKLIALSQTPGLREGARERRGRHTKGTKAWEIEEGS